MNVKHPNYGQNIRILRAALTLGSFTVSELESLSGAGEDTIHSFLHKLRKADSAFMSATEVESTGRGRPPLRYSLTPAAISYLTRMDYEAAARFPEIAPRPHDEALPKPGPFPLIDVYEQENDLVVQADLPGVVIEHVKVEVLENVLTIAGERLAGKDAQQGKFHWAERPQQGRFSRSFSFPEPINPDKIHATFEHNVVKLIFEGAARLGSAMTESAESVRQRSARLHPKEKLDNRPVKSRQVLEVKESAG